VKLLDNNDPLHIGGWYEDEKQAEPPACSECNDTGGGWIEVGPSSEEWDGWAWVKCEGCNKEQAEPPILF
jgi:hypothetical protein